MTERDEKLARAYRDLAREEPSGALDDAILAASRRALARPSGARRWAMPVSIAAMFMLAIGVTLEMQREEPGVEISAPIRSTVSPPRDVAPEPAPAVQPTQEPQVVVPRAKREAPTPKRIEAAPPTPSAPAPAASSSAPAISPPAPAPWPAAPGAAPSAGANREQANRVWTEPPPPAPAMRQDVAPSQAPAMQQDAAPSRAPAVRPEAVRSQAPAAMKLKAITADSLQAELDRIAALRDQGRNAEADKALEEFRRVHPDYRIPDAMWERVKPR